jgi:hypothetical protein
VSVAEPTSPPGQSCPLTYRYTAASFQREPSHHADTVYVIGGLYGNVHALHAILQLQQAEARAGTSVSLVFNGDYNWFNATAASFLAINQIALANVAIQGNVEAEIAQPTDAGCGCNYPDYVNAGYVAASNAIMQRLQRTAAEFPELRAQLGALPMTRTIQVGEERIGIVHGDAEALSGWAFAAESLSPTGKCCSGDTAATAALTPMQTIERVFREARVRAFACTHTCLPHARDFEIDGGQHVIINNGAAGMSNFAGTSFGVITRISADRRVPAASLYGIQLANVRCDALPVHYDHDGWVRSFLQTWPPRSPAHHAYFQRIAHGPDFQIADAIGGNVERGPGGRTSLT